MPTEERPMLRVVRGDPTPEELAALVTAVAATQAAAAPRAPRRRSTWGDPASRVRRPLSHGPGAWRRSGLPG